MTILESYESWTTLFEIRFTKVLLKDEKREDIPLYKTDRDGQIDED